MVERFYRRLDHYDPSSITFNGGWAANQCKEINKKKKNHMFVSRETFQCRKTCKKKKKSYIKTQKKKSLVIRKIKKLSLSKVKILHEPAGTYQSQILDTTDAGFCDPFIMDAVTRLSLLPPVKDGHFYIYALSGIRTRHLQCISWLP